MHACCFFFFYILYWKRSSTLHNTSAGVILSEALYWPVSILLKFCFPKTIITKLPWCSQWQLGRLNCARGSGATCRSVRTPLASSIRRSRPWKLRVRGQLFTASVASLLAPKRKWVTCYLSDGLWFELDTWFNLLKKMAMCEALRIWWRVDWRFVRVFFLCLVVRYRYFVELQYWRFHVMR